MSRDPEVKRVRDWLTRLVIRFREEYDKLTDSEKRILQGIYDCHSPCQLEVFWIKDPEFMILVNTHFIDREDMEIIVHEPTKTSSFLEKAERILEEPRWRREVGKTERPVFPEDRLTHAECLADRIGGCVHQVKNMLFKDFSRQDMGSMIFVEAGYVSLFKGNICELDIEQIVSKEIDTARRSKQSSDKTTEQRQPATKLRGLGTWFYPPVWIGEVPKLSLNDRLNVRYPYAWKKAFNHTLLGHHIVLNQDGLFATNIEDRKEALRIFNTLMDILVVSGRPAHAVREQELAQSQIDPENFTIASYGFEETTLRTSLSDPSSIHFLSPPLRTRISGEEMIEILQKTEKILGQPEHAETLRFLVEAHTHLSNAEFSQAFMMSWIILEKHISDLWADLLKAQDVSEMRKRKLLGGHDKWTIDIILETLNLSGSLEPKRFQELMKLKKKRNDFIHERKRIAKDDAETCVNLSKEVVKELISQYIM